MRRHPFVVEKSDGSLDRHQKELKRLGLRRVSSTMYCGETMSEKKVRKVKLFCSRNYARFYYDDPKWLRNTSYRGTFFRNNPPMRGGTYICVYCGRKIKKDRITVDHVYPIARASSSLRMQKKLERKGIRDINAKENLVPACWNCNMKKGTKMGTWIIRARIGKSRVIWRVRKGIRLAVSAFAVYFLYGIYTGKTEIGYITGYRIPMLIKWIAKLLT